MKQEWRDPYTPMERGPLEAFPHIQNLEKVRDFFTQNETEVSKQGMSALRNVLADWNREGHECTLLLGGSFGFGQVTEETTDIDLSYIGNNLPEFRKRKGEIIRTLNDSGLTSIEEIEDLFVIDIEGVNFYFSSKKNKDRIPDEYQTHSVFYRGEEELETVFDDFIRSNVIGRPLNDRFMKLYHESLSHVELPTIKKLRAASSVTEMLPPQLQTGQPMKASLQKYVRRLERRGVQTPTSILQLIENF